MGVQRIEPPKELLEMIRDLDLLTMTIEENQLAKKMLYEKGIRFRSIGMIRDVYFNRGRINIQTEDDLQKRKTTYTVRAGGFLSKLVAIDDSLCTPERTIIKKYKPGNWESDVRAAIDMFETTYYEALPLFEEEREKQMEQVNRQERSYEISRFEERTRKDPQDFFAWSALAILYEQDARYMDMENAIKRSIGIASSLGNPPNWADYMYLGKAYLAALSNALRGKGIPIWGYTPSNITAESLGYTIEELRGLAKQNFEEARELKKKAGSSEEGLKEVDLALKAVAEFCVTALEEYDRFNADDGLRDSPSGLKPPSEDCTNSEVKRDFQMPTSFVPNPAQEHFKRALDYKLRGELDSAIQEYSQAIALDNNMCIAYINRAELLVLQSNKEAAILDFEKVISISDNHEVIQMAEQRLKELKK